MNKYLFSFLLALGFFIIGIFTLSDYGINWDSPNHMLRGQAFAQFALTGKKTFDYSDSISPVFVGPLEFVSRYYFASIEYLDKKVSFPQRLLLRSSHEALEKEANQSLSFYKYQSWNGDYLLKTDYGHLPMADFFAALSNRFFYELTNILGDTESYQLMYLLFSSIGIFIVSLFAFEIVNSSFSSSGKSYSYLAAAIAGFSLGLFPLFFGDSHFNTKDTMQASFFAGSIWAFWHVIKDNKKIYYFTFFAFIAAALGIKWNIIFIPFILIPWLFLIRKTAYFHNWFKIKDLLKYGVFGIIFIFIFLTAVSPPSWLDPIGRLIKTFDYYKIIGVEANTIQPEGFILPFGNTYPFLLIVAQTPLIIIIFLLIFIFSKKSKDLLKTNLLLTLWFLVPIIRISLPNMFIYSPFRQIMEIIPAMAVIAGIGAVYIIQNLEFRIKNYGLGIKLLKPLFIILYSLFLIVPIIRLHPNENAYFNMLAGGIKGAQEKNLIDWTLTNGNIYKQGVLWLNNNAENNANLAHIDGTMYSISPLWLRDDISLSPDHFSGFSQKGEYIIKLFNPLNPPVFASRYPEVFLHPVHIINVDGIGLLYIYKNDKEHSIINLSNEKKTTQFKVQPVSSQNGDHLEVDLGKNINITRIEVLDSSGKCYKESREAIGFLPEEKIDKGIKTSDLFVINEKTTDATHKKVTFFFPAEKAKLILIYPNDSSSCFAQGKILSVSYLSL